MSRQASKTVIGSFVVGAIALAIAAVLILGSGKFFKQTLKLVCYFEGSVGGLNIGAPVVFRGVKIGSVTDIFLRLETKKLLFVIPVYIEIEPDKIIAVGERPKKMGENFKVYIDRGLRAQLEMQSIVTGQLQVGLDFHPDKPAKFAEFRVESETQEIPTIPTPLQELAQKIQKLPIEEILEKVRVALDGVSKVAASPEIPETVHSINQAAKNVEKLVRSVNEQITQIASNLNETVKDVRKLVQNADGRVTGMAEGLDLTMKDVRKLVQNADSSVTGLTASVDATMKDVRGLVQNVDNRVTDARGLMQNADARVAGLTSNLDGAVTDVRGLVRNVNNGVEPILAGIQKSLESLNATLASARNTMEGIDSSIGDGTALAYQTHKTLEGIDGLAKSIRMLTELLEQRPESLIRGK